MAFADDYNTVPERIIEWREKYPEGTLAPADLSKPFDIVEIGGATFLVVVAAAYRTPDDPKPGIGMAWEPVPGLTNFTRNSELQNAETSAWGRAIIAVGAADAKKGIASREDVQNRRSEQNEPLDDPAAPGLRTALNGAIGKLDDDAKAELKVWFAEMDLPPVKIMDAAQCALVIDRLLDTTPDPGPVVEGAVLVGEDVLDALNERIAGLGKHGPVVEAWAKEEGMDWPNVLTESEAAALSARIDLIENTTP